MDDKSLDAVVAELRHETAGWSSLGVRYTCEQTILEAIGRSPAGTVTRGREDYMGTRHGERKYAQHINIGDDHEVCVLLGYDNVAQCASVRYDRPPNENRQKEITISKTFLDEGMTHFRAIPAPLPYYVGLVPIFEAIRTAERLGPSQVAGRDCVRYRFAGIEGRGGTQDLVYHLDAATSFPLKVESFADRAHLDAASPFSVWEADALGEVLGYHYAPDSKYTTFAPTASGKLIPALVNKYHVASIRFDNAISGHAFWPKADMGVHYVDLIRNTSGYVSPDGKPVPAATTANPLGLPAVGWVGTIGITVAVGLLFIGLRRQFRKP